MNSACAVSQTTTLGSARLPDHISCSLYFLLYLIIYKHSLFINHWLISIFSFRLIPIALALGTALLALAGILMLLWWLQDSPLRPQILHIILELLLCQSAVTFSVWWTMSWKRLPWCWTTCFLLEPWSLRISDFLCWQALTPKRTLHWPEAVEKVSKMEW